MQQCVEIDWSEAERGAFRTRRRLDVCAWTEAHRVLRPDQSQDSGPLRLSRAPHTRGILSLLALATLIGVREVWIRKNAQSGISETVRSYVAWLADQRPTSVMLVLPDEHKGREIVGKYWLPLFADTAPLAAHSGGDRRLAKLTSIQLSNGFTLFLAWAGSPSSMASFPVQVVIADESDKFPEAVGREGDPLTLLRQRMKRFNRDALLIALSTPTLTDGVITRGSGACPIQLDYVAPCPHCGGWQGLRWDAISWPEAEPGENRDAHADRVQLEELAVYTCEHCRAAIQESQRPEMLRRGVWATAAAVRRNSEWRMASGESRTAEFCAGPGHELCAAGSGLCRADWPRGLRVGLHLADWDVIWSPWSKAAAAWLRSQGSPIEIRAWLNSNAGEPYAEAIVHNAPSIFRAKVEAATLAAGVVPRWCGLLLASADVQANRLYYVVRAWGHGRRSQRVAHGVVATLEDLHRVTLAVEWPVDGGGTIRCQRLLIDCGYDVGPIYLFWAKHHPKVIPVKGAAAGGKRLPQPIKNAMGLYRPPPGDPRATFNVPIRLLDTHHWKDELAALLHNQIEDVDSETGEVLGEVEQWALNSEVDDDYERQMANEKRVAQRSGRGTVELWKPVTGGAAQHYWDCEVYQVAGFSIERGEMLRPVVRRAASNPPPPTAYREAQQGDIGRRPLRERRPLRGR